MIPVDPGDWRWGDQILSTVSHFGTRELRSGCSSLGTSLSISSEERTTTGIVRTDRRLIHTEPDRSRRYGHEHEEGVGEQV
jgi:hypothetical protein